MVTETRSVTIKPEYKHTEVGIIPKDWNVLSIPEITKKRSDAIKIGPFGSQLKKNLLVKSGYKVYGQENVYEKNMEVGDRYISKDHFNKLKSCELVSGDFIISMMGTIGKSMVVPENFKPGIMDSHLIRLRFDNKKIKKELLLQIFDSRIILDQIIELSVGSIMEGLSSSIIRKIQIPLPKETEEQSTIAQVLSDTDDLINSLDGLIEKKKNIKQGAMQELLTGKRRLHGFKEQWKIEKLNKNSTLKARIGWQGLTTAEYLDIGDFYLITGTDFVNGKIYWQNCHYVSEHRYSQDPHIQLKTEDILITKDGTIGKVAFVERLRKPATLNSGVFVIRPKFDKYEPKFMYYVLSSVYFKDFLNRLSAGSTISHLYQKDFVDFEFPLPPSIEEQNAITQVLSDMDAEIEELEKRRDKYLMLKKGMMQQLLTGRIRLR